ncbi:DUF1064 domain-containing protein [Xanthomonas sp. PPL568]|uniref:DUF1064 domain-containing protein n=1 Tax=Xanthomonas indica TaxID=2912242 RepID=UPI001F57A5F8|nr:DUF1064 domain-containing protein [Xanthomonas indica]MCI2243255.1 DUF1064 domain-containing protein [Xanthomonas indica]
MSTSKRALRYNSEADMPEGMRKLLQASQQRAATPALRPEEVEAEAAPRRNKYGNVATTVDGIRFDSKREARYYEDLKRRQSAGEVHFWLRQVPIHLPGGTRYVLDFLVFLSDGSAQFVDVKGRETAVFRLKKREVEHHYPIRILLA